MAAMMTRRRLKTSGSSVVAARAGQVGRDLNQFPPPDAQAGTPLAREEAARGNALRPSEEKIADIYEVLERHPVINTLDFVLTGTLEV